MGTPHEFLMFVAALAFLSAKALFSVIVGLELLAGAVGYLIGRVAEARHWRKLQ